MISARRVSPNEWMALNSGRNAFRMVRVPGVSRRQHAKVPCFFFSEKKALLFL